MIKIVSETILKGSVGMWRELMFGFVVLKGKF